MHDATECGVYGGLFEMAEVAGVGMDIERDRIAVPEEVAKLCRLFEMDPYTSISEGSLLLTCRPHAVEAVLGALREANIPATEIGRCSPDAGVRVHHDGEATPLEHPRVDPFWGAFARAASGTVLG